MRCNARTLRGTRCQKPAVMSVFRSEIVKRRGKWVRKALPRSPICKTHKQKFMCGRRRVEWWE